MSFFDENVKVISRRHQRFQDEVVEQFSPSGELEILDTPAGNPTARLDGVYLYSRYNPKREAERTIQKGFDGKGGCFVIFGFGLGYHPQCILEQIPDCQVIIVEPDIPLFLESLKSRDLKELLISDRVHLVLSNSPESVLNLVKRFPELPVKIFRLRGVLERNRDYFSSLDTTLETFLKQRQVNDNTLKRFGKLWIRNLMANVPTLARSPGISSLKGIAEGLPALLLAAGPSLDRTLPCLRDLRDRFLIIAVDTSLRASLRAGVEPDFVLVIDPQYWNTRHLDGTKLQKTILISESSTHPRTFRIVKGKTFFCQSIFPLGTYLEKHTNITGKLGAGGSVATSAWDFARFLGCSRVFAAGLDLGFPELKTHFHGAWFEELSHIKSTRLSPAESDSFHALRDAGPFPVANNSGGQTFTDNRLIIYKWWFENQINRNPAEEYYNVSPEGIKIEGMTLRELDELLTFPYVRDRINKLMDRAFTIPDPDNYPYILSALKNLKEQLEALSHAARKGIHHTEFLRKLLTTGKPIGHVLEHLDSIDRQILQSVSKDIAAFLLQPLIREIMESAEGPDPLAILDTSDRIYRELLDVCEYHLLHIKVPFDYSDI